MPAAQTRSGNFKTAISGDLKVASTSAIKIMKQQSAIRNIPYNL